LASLRMPPGFSAVIRVVTYLLLFTLPLLFGGVQNQFRVGNIDSEQPTIHLLQGARHRVDNIERDKRGRPRVVTRLNSKEDGAQGAEFS
jgi:hypothetical protein